MCGAETWTLREVPVKFRNVVLDKDGEDHWDLSCVRERERGRDREREREREV